MHGVTIKKNYVTLLAVAGYLLGSVFMSWDKFTYGMEQCVSKWVPQNTGDSVKACQRFRESLMKAWALCVL